jgi:hypothetical protein
VPLWKSTNVLQFTIRASLEVGAQFGFWTILEAPDSPRAAAKGKWKCQCFCGTVRGVKGENLKSGLSRSCKCSKASRLEGSRKQLQADWKRKRIASGICLRCDSPALEGRQRCVVCNAKCVKQHKAYRNERIANNQCPYCGKTPAANKKHCQECLYKETAKTFKVSVDEVINIRNSPCEVCGEFGRSVLDHDHRTGVVRGALCNSCNAALGFSKENPAVLQSLIEYINRYTRHPDVPAFRGVGVNGG